MDLLGVGSAALLGLSLGGWTATDFASRHPERVERPALLCPAGIGRQTMGKIAPVFDDERLRRLTMPVLAVVGARDRVSDSAGTVRRLTGLAPWARAEVLPEAGHAVLGQVPRVAEFLRGQD